MDIQAVKQRFGIIGNSPAINYALEVALRVAPTNLTVLITGESGVGKEIFSQIIHRHSPRKHNPFIAVNCGAIPEGTIDSELFGHEKGSFTGASDTRKGYFETVNSGTIFLDEVGELPLPTQSRLLRVLESGEYIKVGSSKVHKTDVRVIAATNVDLHSSIDRNKFREDLYYRLNTVPINVPSLRERPDDIYLLFRKFTIDFAEKYRTPSVVLDNDAKDLLKRFAWPGNVRQLKNIAEQISVLTIDKIVTAEVLKRFLPDSGDRNLPALRKSDDGQSKDFSERELLYKVLFDMRNDLTDLKRFVLQLAGSGSIPPDIQIPSSLLKSEGLETAEQKTTTSKPIEDNSEVLPIVIAQKEDFPEGEIEESLSIADKEKELISKALQRHKGRRKDAAFDLGISERTLYRKIKEYEIAE